MAAPFVQVRSTLKTGLGIGSRQVCLGPAADLSRSPVPTIGPEVDMVALTSAMGDRVALEHAILASVIWRPVRPLPQPG